MGVGARRVGNISEVGGPGRTTIRDDHEVGVCAEGCLDTVAHNDGRECSASAHGSSGLSAGAALQVADDRGIVDSCGIGRIVASCGA